MSYRYEGQAVDLLHHGYDICIIQYEDGKQESVSPDKIVDTQTNKVIIRRTRPSSW
jgi:hypothetical protein